MTIQKYLRSVERIRRLWKKRKYRQVYHEVSSLMNSGAFTANLLVIKATVLSVTNFGGEDLSEIRKLYETATRIEPASLDPLMEMAYHENAVHDNPRKSLAYCEKVLAKCRSYEKKANTLMRQCRKEIAHRK